MQPYWGFEEIHDAFSVLMSSHRLDRQREILVGETEPKGNIAVVATVHFNDGVLIQKHPKRSKETGSLIHIHTLPSEKISQQDIRNVKRLIGNGNIPLEDYHFHLFIITFLRCLVEEHQMNFDDLEKIDVSLQSLYLNPDNNKWLIHLEAHIPVSGESRLNVIETDDGVIEFALIDISEIARIRELLLASDKIGNRSHDKTTHQMSLLMRPDSEWQRYRVSISIAPYLNVILKPEG